MAKSKAKAKRPAKPKADEPPKLRFAAFTRVSTEKQEKQGESLRTQRTDIKQAVTSMRGDVEAIQWYGGGAEHATSGYETKELDRMLADAGRKKFDAIIVAHTDRWSRDNGKNHDGLEVCRKNGIKFFVLSMQYDLFNEVHSFQLAMSAAIGQLNARTQSKKSIENKIHRAKTLNAPTSGNKPYGRTYNKETHKWKVDKDKKRLVENAAERYVNGERMADLAHEMGMEKSNLHKLLTERCGTVWVLDFNSNASNIHAKVEIIVPRLLSEAMIKKVRLKAIDNRKTQPGHKSKYDYLLRGKVYCFVCGRGLNCQPNDAGRLYYRHPRKKDECKEPASKTYVRSQALEEAVVTEILSFYSNSKEVKRAIEGATPDLKETKRRQERLTAIEAEIKKIERARKIHRSAVNNGNLSESDYNAELKSLMEREAKFDNERKSIEYALAGSLSAETIKEIADHVGDKYASARKAAAGRRLTHIQTMSWAEQRTLIEEVFDGQTVDGKPMGVYVEPIAAAKGKEPMEYRFSLLGNLGSVVAEHASKGIWGRVGQCVPVRPVFTQSVTSRNSGAKEATCGTLLKSNGLPTNR